MVSNKASQPELSLETRQNRARSATAPSKKASSSLKAPKCNSEARKQQNRIASKNYREKRKRKLEFLQQLLETQSQSGQSSVGSPPVSLADEFEAASTSREPNFLAPATHPGTRFESFSIDEGNVSGSITATAPSAFDGLVSVSSQSLEGLNSNWPQTSYSGHIQGLESFVAPWDESWLPEMPEFTNDGVDHRQPAHFQQMIGQVSELPLRPHSYSLPSVFAGQYQASISGSQVFSNVGANAPFHSFDPRC